MAPLQFLTQTLSILLLATGITGQYPAPASNFSTIASPADPGVTISYKQPLPGTCTTVFPTQKQFTGYVHIPPNTLQSPIPQNYPVNTFFWFIEARNNASTAPLTIYLNGGPGASSLVGMWQESGPCEVVELEKGLLGTQAREWGWDRSSNIIYIDQPDQVGFSYDTLTNQTVNFITGEVFTEGSFKGNNTAYDGTFPSGNVNDTAGTVDVAAYTIWHMLQAFLTAFPEYNPGTFPNSTQPGAVGVNLFAESYGGKYGPGFAAVWESQNQKIATGQLDASKILNVKLTALGIIQGCVDFLIQEPFYPMYAFNNSYGIQVIDQVSSLNALNAFSTPGGCRSQIEACIAARNQSDPSGSGTNATVDKICSNVNCGAVEVYDYSRNVYDLTQVLPDAFPSDLFLTYLNTASVQQSIGAPLNYSEISGAVSYAFANSGDSSYGGQTQQIASLLNQGVRVGMIYGDRDWICNWKGGEAVSFGVAGLSPQLAPFYSAGYADVVVNSTYVGGQVRQYGNFSFTRVYNAGHLVPAYQPETAFTIFTRIIQGTDISTGNVVNLTSYISNGTANSTTTLPVPSPDAKACYLMDLESTCSEDQIEMIEGGSGVFINGIFYEQESDWVSPPDSIFSSAGIPGTYPPLNRAPASSATGSAQTSSSQVSTTTSTPTAAPTLPTGAYTATGTPSPTSSGAAIPSRHQVDSRGSLVIFLTWLLSWCL